ncbi:hypothetical protein Slin15195_G106640 [Septoria linicola]|uniref:Uncharacterized protein n=1 Tax=Septoria linicola TaxID=215465 RepID=A0A9Q9ENS1_9PEZI|nr:hypothetical protein Slin14017_G069610 [Septoria linicola]USW57345.1 hypothetical protein Slin15195_G106640 [Septoria linicola]
MSLAVPTEDTAIVKRKECGNFGEWLIGKKLWCPRDAEPEAVANVEGTAIVKRKECGNFGEWLIGKKLWCP